MSDERPPPPPPPSLTPPPGYAGYEQNSASGIRGLRTVGGLARWVIALPIAGSVVLLVAAVLTLGVEDEAQAYLDDEITREAFEDELGPTSLLQSLGGALTIAAAVVTVLYCLRITQNHRALGRATTWSPALAAGGWFLPPILFVIPLLVLLEAWKASDPATPPGDDRWRQQRSSPLVFVWWVLFGLAPLAFLPALIQRYGSMSLDTEDLADAIADATVLQISSSAVQVAAAVAWAALIVQLTARHRQLTGEARR